MKTHVLVIHGWAYDTQKWNPLLRLLKRADIDTQMLKVPGLTTVIKKPMTIDDYVTWLKSGVKDNKVVLIGHSNGGRIALNFAIKYPENVKRIILIDSAGIPRRELKKRIKRNASLVIAKVGKQIVKSPKARDLFYKLLREQDYKNAAPVMRETMANLIKSDYQLDPRKIKAPTNIVWGELDSWTPLKDAYTFKEQIKNAQLHVVNGAKHSPQFTHTHEVADYIIGVLDGNL